MTTADPRICPGCGVSLPRTDAPAGRFNASNECWQLYGELTIYTLAQGYEPFIHQLMVDTYGAQHAGPASKPIGTAFALIGLYLAIERGYTGRQVQHMHMLLANRSKAWPTFAPPAHRGDVTVADVVREQPGPKRDQMLEQWARAVWAAWHAEHMRVVSLLTSVMGE